MAMFDSQRGTSAVDNRLGLIVDGGKILGGIAILAAGLVLTLRLSNSDAVWWLVFMAFPVALVAALGARFPPRRLNLNGAALLTAVAVELWMLIRSLYALISTGFRGQILLTSLSAGFISYFMVWIFLGPLLAAIKVVAEMRPSVLVAFGLSLLGYLVGGGALMGLFMLTKPVGLDLAVFFIPLITGIWSAAGALYVLTRFRETGSLGGRAR